MKHLPPATRSWTCPYYVSIVMVTFIVIVAALSSSVVVSWHVVLPIALAFELGFLTGRREKGIESCLHDEGAP